MKATIDYKLLFQMHVLKEPTSRGNKQQRMTWNKVGHNNLILITVDPALHSGAFPGRIQIPSTWHSLFASGTTNIRSGGIKNRFSHSQIILVIWTVSSAFLFMLKMLGSIFSSMKSFTLIQLKSPSSWLGKDAVTKTFILSLKRTQWAFEEHSSPLFICLIVNQHAV